VNTETALDLITARQTAATEFAGQLREQITKLTADLAQVEDELADLDTTRKTLLSLTAEQVNSPTPAIASEPYQQILAALRDTTGPLRAKDICLALGLGTAPKDVEGVRAKLKRLVRRQILTETKPGAFTIDPAGSRSN
jgi:nitrate/nitrite-specific signal transduction histidine kinase